MPQVPVPPAREEQRAPSRTFGRLESRMTNGAFGEAGRKTRKAGLTEVFAKDMALQHGLFPCYQRFDIRLQFSGESHFHGGENTPFTLFARQAQTGSEKSAGAFFDLVVAHLMDGIRALLNA